MLLVMGKLFILFLIPFLHISQDIHYNQIYNSNLDYKGEFKIGFTWFDSLGKNTLILSGARPNSDYLDTEQQYGPIEILESGYVVKNVYAYHYVGSDLIWDLKEFSDTFIWVDEVSITDLDGDGVSETWIGYDSKKIKVIMHEGKKKYAVRGYIKSRSDDNGDDVNDWIYDMYGKNSFEGSPAIFRKKALELWESIANMYTMG